ncbi:hypothetical protein [Rhizobium sp. CCGE 510]|uniref:hypothetical protein n=1 Tax=Rhizobium sp. CCGE 510 TaxID=1132836 RepID=UPI00027B8841|nr:hypothetical protein [Rhizobium sp. CCGE 510]EJT05653.1 dimethylglycine dehydrogenase [Rhizobium sp. CCGE 510]
MLVCVSPRRRHRRHLGFRFNRSLAFAILPPDYAAEGTKLKIKILSATYNATVVGGSPFNTENAALRG